MNDRIFKARKLSAAWNKVLIIFIYLGEKLSVWLLFFCGMPILQTRKAILLCMCIFHVHIKEILASPPLRQAHSKRVAASEWNIFTELS